MTEWSKKQLGPVPPVKADGVIQLSDIIDVTAFVKDQRFEFWPLSDSCHSQPYDVFTVDLSTHVLTRG
jgi:hypothetical protein